MAADTPGGLHGPPPPCASLPDDASTSIPAPGQGVAWTVIATPYTGEQHARGLAARVPLARGTCIEVAPCLPITADEYRGHGESVRALREYAFSDPARSGGHLLALGCGSLFNHARRPNVDYRVDFPAATIRFYAARDIPAGEELTISYGHVWWEEGGGGEEGRRGAATALPPSHDHLDDADGFLSAIGL